MTTHAQSYNGNDYTLCGYALDGTCLEGDDGEPEVAAHGDIINCYSCLKIIDHCKTFKRNRQP